MPHPSLDRLLHHVIIVRAALSAASAGYSSAVIIARLDVAAAESALREAGARGDGPGVTAAWCPPVPILVAQLRAVRVGLESAVMGRAAAGEHSAALSPALIAIGKAITHLLVAASISGELVEGARPIGLHAIADDLQAGLDRIDAMRDRSAEIAVASCHVQAAIDRLRIEAGAPPIDACIGAPAL